MNYNQNEDGINELERIIDKRIQKNNVFSNFIQAKVIAKDIPSNELTIRKLGSTLDIPNVKLIVGYDISTDIAVNDIMIVININNSIQNTAYLAIYKY